MKTMGKVAAGVVAFVAVAALVVAPAAAGGKSPKVPVDIPTAQAALYEVTENMYLLDANGQVIVDPTTQLPVKRSAVASLFGWARLGTPLCPTELLVTNAWAQTCTLTANGSDELALSTLTGGIRGDFAVVLQDTNAADAPEFVVMNGLFTGTMDLSTRPIGRVAGTLSASTGVSERFCGTLRLPFNLTKQGQRELQVKRGAPAYYLADDGRTLIPVQAGELSLGIPTVRFELSFGTACGS